MCKMYKNAIFTLLMLTFFLAGCSTQTKFILPEGTQIKIYGRPAVDAGEVTMRPFFWNVVGGVPYELVKDGESVRTGKLGARFRAVSIFWPPGGLIYWPFGFGGDCFNLVDPEGPGQKRSGC